MKSMDVTIQTKDNISIAGTYIPGSLPFGVVLLHMMPANKESYNSFAELLSQAGFHTLAIDFRGHGQSAGGDYTSFTDKEHQKYYFDLQAAIEYLHKQNPEMRIGIVGASIGANISIQYATEGPLKFIVLLSPGVNYYGINAGELISKIPADLPIYFISALDDDRVNGNSLQTETLYQSCASNQKHLNVFKSGGHGTNILANNPGFLPELIEWIKGKCL